MQSPKLYEAIKKREEQEKKEKSAVWAEVKNKTPEIANFIILLTNNFGKLKAIYVEHEGSIILNHGERLNK